MTNLTVMKVTMIAIGSTEDSLDDSFDYNDYIPPNNDDTLTDTDSCNEKDGGYARSK